MTLIVGILCSDGVVMASDSAASLGVGFVHTIGQQPVTKIHNIDNAILYGSTGGIGMSQLLIEKVRSIWSPTYFANARCPEAAHKIGSALAEVVKVYATNAQAFQQIGGFNGMCQSLVAIPTRDGPSLFQFDNGGVPESATKELPCVSLGSGQQIADPFLAFLRKILWKNRTPTMAEGRLVAAWTVRHVAETNPGGVDLPLQMSCLTLVGGKPVIEPMGSEEEHFQQIDAAENALRDYLLKKGDAPLDETAAIPPPEPPKATA